MTVASSISTQLFHLSTLVLVILNMHEMVRKIRLVKTQKQNAKGWWMVLQGRFLLSDCLDLVLMLLPLYEEQSVSLTVYKVYKLWLLFPLVMEGTSMQVEEGMMGKRWWAGMVIYCLMLCVNIVTDIMCLVR